MSQKQSLCLWLPGQLVSAALPRQWGCPRIVRGPVAAGLAACSGLRSPSAGSCVWHSGGSRPLCLRGTCEGPPTPPLAARGRGRGSWGGWGDPPGGAEGGNIWRLLPVCHLIGSGEGTVKLHGMYWLSWVSWAPQPKLYWISRQGPCRPVNLGGAANTGNAAVGRQRRSG